MPQHHSVGSILIALFLGTWGTLSLELHPWDEGSHVHWGWESAPRFSKEQKLPSLEDKKMKMHEIRRPKLSNEKIKFLIWNLLGEESSLLCYGNKRLLHGSCLLIRAWVDEGLAGASWLKCKEWSVGEGRSEAWSWPHMQWLLLWYVLCHLGLPPTTLLALPAFPRATAPEVTGVQSLIEALSSGCTLEPPGEP